ncbi:MAG TPA: DUF4082 domain-containing protein [Ktedonobacterales bacterium]|nr:DUF4082 domain-containing protein [Ktedonobacterales bacterium]
MGFSTDISVNVGGTVAFKVKTSAANYTIAIYRIGYYQGLGARLITSLTPVGAQTQPACLTVAATGLTDCGNWAVSATWAVPASAVSGIYYALLTDTKTGLFSHVPFIVRNDSSQSDIVFKTNDTTWQAYNDYGGNSLYYGTAPTGCGALNQYSCGRAYKVSYNRPYNDQNEGAGYGTSNYIWYAEYPMVRWLELNGYNVSYMSSIDIERYSSLLRNHRAIVSAGHDEYWSGGERTAIEGARDAGVNIMSLTGNTMFWKTRWENAIDGSNTTYRTLVSYKETLDNKVEDPLDPTVWTGTWRDARFSPPADGGRPENGLLGTSFAVNRGSGDPVISSAFARLRYWRNTAAAALTGSQTLTLATQTIGYEWDNDTDNGFRPTGLIDMASTPISASEVIQDQGNIYQPGTVIWSPTLYRASSGALVFSTGTVQWSWGLDVNHAQNPDFGPNAVDPTIQQSTVNMLADMQAQPATLQSGLVLATASTDSIAPTSSVTSPAAGGSVTSRVPVTVTGSATDSGGGVVADVEVSIDGGTTWHRAKWSSAAGSITWSYVWTPQSPGTATIMTRAVDDSGNIEGPSAGRVVNVQPPTCPCTLFTGTEVPAAADAVDNGAVEVGVKFKADAPGSVTGVKFYKGVNNTGTHTGSLWGPTGQLLATGTFTNESASGWQTLTFATPVNIQPNTVYTVSYHTTVGQYALNQNYYNNGLDAWPLHAPATAKVNGNGVFAYGGSQYPTQSYLGSNYWVDVIYTSPWVSNPTPAVVSNSPTSGATGVSLGSKISVGFSENVSAGSINLSVTGPNNAPVSGTVTYDANLYAATFTPAALLAGNTNYTVTVSGATDANGRSLPSPFTWSFTTLNCPCTVFPSNATPGTINSGDPNSVELGMKFTADTNGYINGVRFYKGPTNTGTHIGSLWTSTGQLLARVTFGPETATGWQQGIFSTPVAITAGTTYVVSYHTNAGGYSYDAFGLAGGVDAGDLHVPNSSSVNGNGVYAYGGNQFPNQTYNAANYWVDVVFNFQQIDMVPPSVVATSPAANALGVSATTAITATFDRAMTGSTIQVTVTNPANQPVNGTTTYNSTNLTATFQPSAALAAGTIYTVTVSGGMSQSGIPMTAPFSWSFRTVGACPCSLFLPTQTPGTVSAQDSASLELGMKFTADVNGSVTGVRFYKGPSNTGTHIGNLWSSTGQLLATVTFTNETASGWQQANFAQPVAITAGTIYVISYHTNVGFYSFDPAFFNNSVDNAPLHGVATGTSPNGLFVYGGTQFPTGSYNAGNYWVDVVFTTP